jgi:multidrug efflux pump subunit AcrA (membrane-fusion protein)
MKNKNRKWLWISITAIVLLALLIAFGKNKDEGTKVSVEKVATHTITETVTASGKIYPETEVKISPEVSGEIIELNINEGDSVAKGQLLVKITHDELKDLMGGVAVVSYGVLLFEDDNSIILASTLGDNAAFAGEFCILKGTIKEIKTIDKIKKKEV